MLKRFLFGILMTAVTFPAIAAQKQDARGTPAEAKVMLAKAVTYYKANGRAKARAVVGNQTKAAAEGYRTFRRRSPERHTAFDRTAESRDEVLISADRRSVLEPHPDNLVTAELVISARSMKGDKGIAPIFRGKLRAGVKYQSQRRRMRAQKDFRRFGFGHQVRAPGAVGGIGMRAVIGIGPAKKITRARMAQEIRRRAGS